MPRTVAVNCCDCPGCKVELAGEIETAMGEATGITVTVALADRPKTPRLLAVMVISSEGAVTDCGAA